VAENRIAGGRPAVVLLSGGLDSTTALALAVRDGFEVHAMTFRYGQRHEVEVTAARDVAAAAGVRRHIVVDIDLGVFGGSALTEPGVAIPKGRDPHAADEIPITYVPARNTVFLSYALAWAEVLEADDVFVGVTAVDYSGYPDCRPEYVAAFEEMANLATRRAVEGHRLRVHAPLVALSKAEIVRTGLDLGIDYAMTRSCYDPAADGGACGECDACTLRLEAFAANGLADPAPYVAAHAR
jgi:7-cyano-7-deazaguanine synthase